jgi:hypothetical protein
MTPASVHNSLVARQEGDRRTRFPFVAAVSLNEAGHPIYARITAVSGFSSEAIGGWVFLLTFLEAHR